MTAEQLAELLKEVRRTVREEMARTGEIPKPRAVSPKVACVMLGVKPTKLKEMVRLGLIRQVQYDEDSHPKIPMTEIERLTTPRETDQRFSGPKVRAPRRLPKRDVQSEIEKLSGILKKKRRG